MTNDPLDPRALRRTFGDFATGVTIVTCLGPDGAPVGMTANSFASVSLDPPLVLWSVDRKARSCPAFEAASAFAFSILAEDQVALSNRFAKPGADKFAEVMVVTGRGGVPLIDGAAAHIECVPENTVGAGDHLTMIGRVVRHARYDRPGLTFAQGRYGTIAPHPGAVAGGGQDLSERHPYDDFLVPLLFRAYNHMFDAVNGVLTAHGTTGAQMRILAILAAEGPVAADVLLTRTLLSQSRFDEVRAGLATAGLVEGGASLAITAAGRARFDALLAEAAASEDQSTGVLGTAEVERLKTLLKRLVQHHESGR
ncbi:MAG: flavin reductase family protein [Pseudomonadota bacterium]